MVDQKIDTQNTKIAKEILHEPILLRRLSDRVYELMMEDLRIQSDRSKYIKRIF